MNPRQLEKVIEEVKILEKEKAEAQLKDWAEHKKAKKALELAEKMENQQKDLIIVIPPTVSF